MVLDYCDYRGVLDAAQAAGAGTAIIRPLDGGALSMAVIEQGASARHANAGGLYTRNPELFNEQARRAQAFRFLQRPERSLPHAAFAFLLGNPAVSTVIGGFSDRAQFEELRARLGAPPLAPEELREIAGSLPQRFLASRKRPADLSETRRRCCHVKRTTCSAVSVPAPRWETCCGAT